LTSKDKVKHSAPYRRFPPMLAAKVAARQMSRFGGVMAIEFKGGYDAAYTFLGQLQYQYARCATSLNSVWTIAVHPAGKSRVPSCPRRLPRSAYARH
jgi:methionine-gamma-lyase